MRYALFLLAVTLLAQTTPLASIEGRVVDDQGKPVARARVAATRVGYGTFTNPLQATQSDDSGMFTFRDLAPGTNYSVVAEKAGYLDAFYGRRSPEDRPWTFDLEPGQVYRDVVLTLRMQGVITGTVTDQAGDPVPNATLFFSWNSYRQGRRTLLTYIIAAADDRGVYRASGFTPGRRYFVQASEKSANVDSLSEPAVRVQSREVNLNTYFGNTTDWKKAKPLVIVAGEEVRADIVLRKARVYNIRGRVVDTSGAPLKGGLITAKSPNDSVPGDTRMIRPDGTFELARLSAGSWTVAMVPSNKRELGSTEVAIAGSDVEDVVVSLRPLTNLTGRVKTDGDPGQGTPPNGYVILSIPSDENALSGSVKKDGTFEIQGVDRVEYHWELQELPDGFYVKSARLGGTDVSHRPLNMPGGPLEITVSSKGAEISGVRSAPQYTVVLWPLAPNPAGNRIRVIPTQRDPAFRFAGLAPGEYRMAAFDVDDTGMLWNADLLAKFPEAIKIEVAEGAKIKADPPLIPVARFNEELKNLP